MEPQLEVRAVYMLETRGRRLEGYAALFGTQARMGDFVETVAPGAFSAALRSNDVLALVDHDPSKLLARTSSGTLSISEDGHGLHFALSVPDTTVGRDVLQLALRKDLGGMSFGFLVPKGGEEWNGNVRTLTKVDLKEISVVSSWPAYAGTTIQARARAAHGRAEPAALRLARLYLETLEK